MTRSDRKAARDAYEQVVYIDDVPFSYDTFRELQEANRQLRDQAIRHKAIATSLQHEVREYKATVAKLEAQVNAVKRWALWIGNDRCYGVMDELRKVIANGWEKP